MRTSVESAEERLQRLLALQSLLASISRQIGPALELAPVLRTVLDGMRTLMEFRGGSICLVDENRQIYIAAADPAVSPEVMRARLPVGSGLAGRVVAEGRSLYSPDLDEDERVDQRLRRLGSNAGMTSYLAVPLICVGRAIGLMQVDSPLKHAFSADDVHVLEGLATQVAGAIEGARQHEQIVQFERMQGDFMARVSHELRTPVTIVAGFMETLLELDGAIPPEERIAILRRAHAASRRLQNLVDELLTVTGYEAGVLNSRPEELTVTGVLEEFCRSAPAAVEVRGDVPIGFVADRRLVLQALRLLVDNAVRYGRGRVELVTGVDTAGTPYLEVRDDGPGVPAQLRPVVFDRFTRGDATVPGLGLGLPLARQLAAGFGAEIDLVDVDADAGACFRLSFPKGRTG